MPGFIAERSSRPARATAVAALALSLALVACLSLAPAASAAYNWTSLGGPSPDDEYIVGLTFDDAHGVLYAYTWDEEVFKYESGTWSSTHFPTGASYIACIEFDTTLDTLFIGGSNAADNAAVWALHDGNWSQLGEDIAPNSYVLSVYPSGTENMVFCGSFNGTVYACSVNDPGWFPIGSGTAGNSGIDSLARDVANDITYAGTYDSGSDLGCVYRCAGGGAWETWGTFADSWTPSRMLFDPSRSMLYAALAVKGTAIPNVYRRNTQAGGGWQAIGTLCGGPQIYDMELDVQNDFLFAGAYDGHAYKNPRASAGSTWVDMGSPAPGSQQPVSGLAYSPSSATLYACTFSDEAFKTSLPRLTSISPDSGRLGQTLEVELKATAGQFTDQSSAVFSGDGVKVNSTSRLSADRVRANVTINPETYLGPRDVWVKTGGETTTRILEGFTVLDNPPPPRRQRGTLPKGRTPGGSPPM